jgi:hypothetical protein
MRIHYDVEFLEDGRSIDLISIGMVADDGRELYAVNEDIDVGTQFHERILKHPWLMANVVPHLPLLERRDGWPPYELAKGQQKARFALDGRSNTVQPMRMIRNQVRDFVLEAASPELWAWYGAYDHVALCQIFGRMIDLPKGFPWWTNDLKQELVR